MRIGSIAWQCLGAGALFIAGYWLGSANAPPANENSALDVQAADAWNGAEPEVQDAIQRWSLKAAMPEEDILRMWSPRAMFIPTRNQGQGMLCIQLQLRPGNLGGSPVYCYEDDFFRPKEATKLLAEYSDVE